MRRVKLWPLQVTRRVDVVTPATPWGMKACAPSMVWIIILPRREGARKRGAQRSCRFIRCASSSSAAEKSRESDMNEPCADRMKVGGGWVLGNVSGGGPFALFPYALSTASPRKRGSSADFEACSGLRLQALRASRPAFSRGLVPRLRGERGQQTVRSQKRTGPLFRAGLRVSKRLKISGRRCS